MQNLILLLEQYGVLIVFGVVLMEQIGLPIPAYPVLIVAGAMSVKSDFSWPMVAAMSLLACLVSDYFWFQAGRHYGKRILKLLCKISLSPDYCVSQTEDNYSRFGPKSLIVAKFVPGFNTIAPPLAGAMGTSTARFLGFTLLGGVVWSGSGIAIGMYFHDYIDEVLDILSTMGGAALAVLAGLLVVFILFKYWERRNFQKGMEIERIGMEELVKLVDGGEEPLIIDARSATAQKLEAPIPGALIYYEVKPEDLLSTVDKGRHIVVYCSCPNDVSAAQVAKELMSHGYKRARPLHGGLDAWNAHHSPAV